MMEWTEYRWVIWLAIVVVLVILLDEWAYNAWKQANPGHMYSHLKDRTVPLVDPSTPPYTIVYE